MAKIQAEGIVEYARIFADTYDDNMDFHENTRGQYNMNFYPDNVEAVSYTHLTLPTKA